MAQTELFLKGKKILAVDDEKDVIETIEEILCDADIDVAYDFETAFDKLSNNSYDVAILDIMGVNGIKLLEHAVKMNIPAVMLTANSMNPESLMQSIQKGAISYIPKEHLSQLDSLLSELLGAKNDGKPTWKLLFERLGNSFNQRFGDNWKDDHKEFWTDFEQDYQVSRGIQERLLHDQKIIDKGI